MNGNPAPDGVSSVLDPSDPAYAGQATYTPWFLAHVYDPLVLRFNNRCVWRCTSTALTRHYDSHVSAAHLDVGPGTAYYLDRCQFPVSAPEITLLDPNGAVLAASSARLHRYSPRVHQASVLEPIGLPAASFDSIGLGHVLHCLPGTMESKTQAIANLRPLLRPGGQIFGSTVLAAGVRHTVLSRRVMSSLNHRGIFHNLDDDLMSLHRTLEAHLTNVEIRIQGTVALFAGRAST